MTKRVGLAVWILAAVGTVFAQAPPPVSLYVGARDDSSLEGVYELLRRPLDSFVTPAVADPINPDREVLVIRFEESVLLVDAEYAGMRILEDRLKVLEAFRKVAGTKLITPESVGPETMAAIRRAYQSQMPGLPRDESAPLLVRPELTLHFERNGVTKRVDFLPPASPEALAAAADKKGDPLPQSGDPSPLSPRFEAADSSIVVFDPRHRMTVSMRAAITARAYQALADHLKQTEDKLRDLQREVLAEALGGGRDVLSADPGVLGIGDLPEAWRNQIKSQIETDYASLGFSSPAEAAEFLASAKLAKTTPWWTVSVMENSGSGHSLISIRLELGPER